MPRQKEYDRDRVLESAMKVFWQKGYDGTSMQDLVEATGLNRFGMYQEFGSKEGLFRATLDKYRDYVTQLLFGPMIENPRGLASIRDLFNMVLSYSCQPGAARGCLMTNTAISLPTRDEQTAHCVQQSLQRIEDAFYRNLEVAQDKGEIRKDADLRELAQYLVGVMQGFTVLTRVDPRCDRLRNFAKVALESIAAGAAE